MEVGSLVSVREAATMLGVSRQKVQQLVSEHRLPAVKVGTGWQMSILDVARLQHVSRRSGRPFPPARAWQVIRDAETTGHVEVPRGSATRDAFWLAHLARRRATVLRLHGLETLLDELEPELVAGGEDAARLHGFAPRGSIRVADGYITHERAKPLIARYALTEAHGAELNIILRVVDDAVWPFNQQDRTVGRLVAALDMIDTPIDDRSVDSAVPVVEAYL